MQPSSFSVYNVNEQLIMSIIANRMENSYNTRNPAVKRLMREAEELRRSNEFFLAYPVQDNLFDWHFSIRGPDDTEFQGGIYHGRIILPQDYPMKPPSVMFLTPNGRFETSTKICLSITDHHPEYWQPCWSLRTVLLAIVGFMPTPGEGAIGSLDFSKDERHALPPVTVTSVDVANEAKKYAQLFAFKASSEVMDSVANDDRTSNTANAEEENNPPNQRTEVATDNNEQIESNDENNERDRAAVLARQRAQSLDAFRQRRRLMMNTGVVGSGLTDGSTGTVEDVDWKRIIDWLLPVLMAIFLAMQSMGSEI
ncbi:ubiquitin--protein ligase [Trichinella nativa]|uniref:Ubiquitin--protein ligase n=1 Tax=Trichinella nativa TaxID=6335 RepID=A0A1Y3EM00_9BILA|nr:ubiquitin--protein ligase [Trichinella nativa]